MKCLKSNPSEIGSKHLAVLNKQKNEIVRIISEITESIANLKKLLYSNDISLVSAYESRNTEFRRLPPKLTVFFPSFTPLILSTDLDQFFKPFDSLSASSIKTEEHGYTIDAACAKLSLQQKTFTNEPRVLTYINSVYGRSKRIGSVHCQSNDEIWTCGADNMIRLFNLQREQVKSISVMYGNCPEDIAVTMSGDLAYADFHDRSVSIVKDTQIQTVIRIQEWKPRNFCCTASDYFLVVMDNYDEKQTKVVRYYGSTEVQTIQHNEKGQPLYSFAEFTNMYSIFVKTKYICENTNLDICVSDIGARAVVVVNQAGKLRFTYTIPLSLTKPAFEPAGITTDSQSRILIADCFNNCIHILDQDGQFLRYIDNCDLQWPLSLCVDTKDNLFVAEFNTGIIKKIQYYE
nr:uncharacterized protein LOC105335645 isoform X1 [Crassostrea gigas]